MSDFKKYNEILNAGIEELDLSVETCSCLKKNGIYTIGKLIDKIVMTDDNLLRIGNLGIYGKKEVIEKLKAKGLRLRRKEESVQDVLKEYENFVNVNETNNYLNALNNFINKSALPEKIKKYWNRFYSSLKLPDTITIMESEPEIESLNLAVLNRIDSCVNQLEIPDYIKLYWDKFYSELASTIKSAASTEVEKLEAKREGRDKKD